MVCTPLPEPPRVPLYTPNHLVFIGKVRLPQKRAVAKHPYRLRRITAWSCAASKLTGGRFSRTALLGWILFRRVAARHRLFCSSLTDFEGCPCFINSRFRSVWCDAWWRGVKFANRTTIPASFPVLHRYPPIPRGGELNGALMARDREPCYSSCCIECGRGSNQALYKEFSGGTIQLSQCVSFAVVLNLALYLPLPSSSPSPPPHPQLTHRYTATRS